MTIVELLIVSIVLLGIGIGLIIFGLYLKKVNDNFKNNGVDLSFKVIDVKTEDKLDAENNKIGEFYITTFEFTYEGKTIKESLQTRHKFKKNIEVPGKYLPTAKLNKISVAGEGFFLPPRVPLFLIGFGIFLLLLLIIIIIINI